MALAKELLEIICCPESKQPLRLLERDIVERFNEKIRAGVVRNRGEKLLDREVSDVLMREDSQVFYPVREDIPILLIDEAIDAAYLA